MSSVIASVEDTLGLPSPHELAMGEGGQEDEEAELTEEEEVKKLAESKALLK